MILQQQKKAIRLMKTHLGACFDTLMRHQHRYVPPPSAKVATEGYHMGICGCHRDKRNEHHEKKCFGQQLSESLIHHSSFRHWNFFKTHFFTSLPQAM